MKKVAVIGCNSALASVMLEEIKNDFDWILYGRNVANNSFDVKRDLKKYYIHEGIDTCIYFAAKTTYQNDEEILEMFEVNVTGLLKACIKAKESGVKH